MIVIMIVLCTIIFHTFVVNATEWGEDYRNALRPSVCPSFRYILCPCYNLSMH